MEANKNYVVAGKILLTISVCIAVCMVTLFSTETAKEIMTKRKLLS